MRISSGMVLVALTVLLGMPAATQAQETRGWFPNFEPFERLIAAPREIQFRGAFILADREVEPGFEGRNIEAEVVLGQRFGIYRFDDNEGLDGAFSLHVEIGIFSRFFMEEKTRDLVNSDFRVGFPFEYRTGSWQLRAGYRHLSSHIGDDYVNRFPAFIEQTSKDGVEAMVAYRATDAFRVYGGADYNFHTNLRMSRSAIRGGAEFDAVVAGDGDAVWPFLAADMEYFSLSEKVGVTLTGGIGFRVRGRLMRVEGRGHFGPTFVAQFRETDESFFGLGIRAEI